MDMTNYVEGQTVTVEVVKNSPSKQLVLLSAGAEKEIEGRKKLIFMVEMDGKQVYWYPNKTTLKNLVDAYGKESNGWIGKMVTLSITTLNGREAVLGIGIATDTIFD